MQICNLVFLLCFLALTSSVDVIPIVLDENRAHTVRSLVSKYKALKANKKKKNKKNKTKPSPPSPPSPPPPTSPITCSDVQDWKDSYGYSCSQYAQKNWCKNWGWCCENDGFTPNQACCTCGGGINQNPTPPISPPPPPPPPPPPSVTCMDVQGWEDSYGFTCSQYGKKNWCKKWGSCCKNDGFTPNEACCTCGGGNLNLSPSQTPSNKPTVSPVKKPSASPSDPPSVEITGAPSFSDTSSPSKAHSENPSFPQTDFLPIFPSVSPSFKSPLPSSRPSKVNSEAPSNPSSLPSKSPLLVASSFPSLNPSAPPSNAPTDLPLPPPPSFKPSLFPSKSPVKTLSTLPSLKPSDSPSKSPISIPPPPPSSKPSAFPSKSPVTSPSSNPSDNPSANPVTYRPGELTVVQNGLLLSTGLTSRIIAHSGEFVLLEGGRLSSERFHQAPDGASIFDEPNGDGYVYVSNSEASSGSGGVGAIYFSSNGEVIDYKMLLTGTTRNCGGGKTPFKTWLTCEEVTGGRVYEVDPYDMHEPVQTRIGPDSGGKYESAAYDNRDPYNLQFFVTEDSSSGVLTRFVPDPVVVARAYESGDYWPVLSSPGINSYLVINPTSSTEGTFYWSSSFTEGRNSASTYFPYSEGIDIRNGKLYFVVKTLKKLFILDLDNLTYTSSSTVSGAFNRQPDQITSIIGGKQGILYFCEDGGNDCGVHGRDSDGKFFTILDGPGYDDETTGLAFTSDRKRMYVSFQGTGVIFEIRREDDYPFDGATLDIKYHAV